MFSNDEATLPLKLYKNMEAVVSVKISLRHRSYNEYSVLFYSFCKNIFSFLLVSPDVTGRE